MHGIGMAIYDLGIFELHSVTWSHLRLVRAKLLRRG